MSKAAIYYVAILKCLMAAGIAMQFGAGWVAALGFLACAFVNGFALTEGAI